MAERRSNLMLGQMKVSNAFVVFWEAVLLLFTLAVGMLVLLSLSAQFPKDRMGQYMTLRNSFLLFMAVQLVANVAILVVMVLVLHRNTGGLYRIETVLDNIISGDVSKRIQLRKEDNPRVRALADKLNAVFDLMQKGPSGNH